MQRTQNRTAGTPAAPDDELLVLDEIAELKRTTPATERWLRHEGRAPYLFRSGRRLVGWKSEVLAHLAAERAADRRARGDAQ